MKGIRTALLFFGLMVFCAISALSNVRAADCFEVKHLDFFGIDESTRVSWSDSEWEALLNRPESESGNDTGFLIPLLVVQLKDFYPACNKEIDQKRYANLKRLYFKIRKQEIPRFDRDEAAKVIEFIRDDFYTQLQDDRSLASMIFTFDDGPFYGAAIESGLTSSPYERVKTDFGELTLSRMDGGIALAARDKEGKVMWAKLMEGVVPERKLRNMTFVPEPIQKTSLATIAHFFAEGERLRVYMRPDGRFMFYYDSW
ncbi:MAG: hypothetical protein J5I65_13550 [Aridibacter famidurans]|nr:hypothetical protein [Aridibacter famidurans]